MTQPTPQPQLTCTRCGFRGDVVTETQKIGGHIFVCVMLALAVCAAGGALFAAAGAYVAALDLGEKRAEMQRKEASMAPTTGPTMVPVRLKNGEVGRMPLAELDNPTIERVLSPAQYREAVEVPIQNSIDWDRWAMIGSALLVLLCIGAAIVSLDFIGKRQRYWQTYAFCAACNAPLGRLRGR